jgi:hypothetical protein
MCLYKGMLKCSAVQQLVMVHGVVGRFKLARGNHQQGHLCITILTIIILCATRLVCLYLLQEVVICSGVANKHMNQLEPC